MRFAEAIRLLPDAAVCGRERDRSLNHRRLRARFQPVIKIDVSLGKFCKAEANRSEFGNKAKACSIYPAECNLNLETTMLKRGKTALIVAITLGVLGSASIAWAGSKDDDGGGGAGGFVIPGSMDGVNPVYHPDLFGRPSNAFARAHAQTTSAHAHRKISRY
jgi:hypothetical protein